MRKLKYTRRKIAASVLAGAMVFGLAACGSSDSGTEAPAATAQTSAAASTEDAGAEPDEDPDVDPDAEPGEDTEAGTVRVSLKLNILS